MRCIVRALLVGLLLLLFLIYIAVRTNLSSGETLDYDESDEEARRILEGQVVGVGTAPTKPVMSLSVALILIVCLIGLALLITGIIIVAITLDPTNTYDDEESDIESSESKSLMSPTFLNSDDDIYYENMDPVNGFRVVI